jgi:putative ABC transport system permease protein
MTPAYLRFYRALLRLYPASFRIEYGDRLCDAFIVRCARHAGPLAPIAKFVAAVADVVPNAIGAHAELLRRDLRYAARAARRAPLFFVGATLVLALGTGANGAVFSIVHAVLLEPLPYRTPSELVMLWDGRGALPPAIRPGSEQAREFARGLLTPEMVDRWRRGASGVFSDVAAARSWRGNSDAQFDVILADGAERLRASFATPNFFDVLGATAWYGRTFTASDEASGAELAVISHSLWQRAFGAEESIVGRALTIDGGRPRIRRTYTIVGVLRPEFRFTYPDETEMWALESWADVARYPSGGVAFNAVARLRAGATPSAVAQQLAAMEPVAERLPDRAPLVEPIAEWVAGGTRASLLMLVGVAIALLAIACVTVSSALFVRFTARRRELALRASLGANPRVLVRQLLTEGAALALLGTALGTLFAVAAGPVLRSIVPPSYPRADEIGVNAWIVVFAAAVSVFTTTLAAVAPAWRGSRFDLVTSLKQSAGTMSPDRATSRWRQGMVALQSGTAAVLLIVAAFLLTSLWQLSRVPLGFDPAGVMTVEMRLMGARFRDEQRVAALQNALVQRLRGDPAIDAVGLTTAVPFRGVDFVYMVNKLGDSVRHTPNGRTVDSAYFSIMGIPLLRGRVFNRGDAASARMVAVISASLAREMFGANDPIGSYLDMETPTEIVGVVADVRYRRLDQPARPALYLAREQVSNPLLCLVVRPRRDFAAAAAAIRAAVRDVDPALPAMNLTTISEIIHSAESGRRFYSVATASFAAIAVLLTLVGLAIVVSRAVQERAREMAIRAALGGTGGRLLWPLLRQGVAPVVVGVSAGGVVAMVAAPAIGPFLYGVSPRDPVVYLVVAVGLVLSGTLTALVPARRVSRAPAAAILRMD